MVGFPSDGRPVGSTVSDVTDPFGRLVTFSQDLSHDKIGNGWATWSHGYTGDVYDTINSTDPFTLTIGLPDPVHAFYFFTEPNNFDFYQITATAQDGTTVSQNVAGASGAKGFGFTRTRC
jgi:membrane-bound inhibitor of C-type lysozyme